MEARSYKNEEGKRWLTLEVERMDTSYNNHSGSHASTVPRLSQGVSNDHAPALCPVPRGWPSWCLCSGSADKRRAGGALRGRRVSHQVILSIPHQLSAVSVFSFPCYLWALALSSLRSWQAVLPVCFLLIGEDWVIRSSFTPRCVCVGAERGCSLCVFHTKQSFSWKQKAEMQRYASTDMKLWPLTLSASWTWLLWLASISSSWGMSASGFSQSRVTFRHKAKDHVVVGWVGREEAQSCVVRCSCGLWRLFVPCLVSMLRHEHFRFWV